jgi:hypothetical protein
MFEESPIVNGFNFGAAKFHVICTRVTSGLQRTDDVPQRYPTIAEGTALLLSIWYAPTIG